MGFKNSVQKALDIIKSNEIAFVDLKFADLLGTWQHLTIPVSEVNEEIFTTGIGFDGSSIRAWKGIAESDMLVVPDPATIFIEKFAAVPTVSFICNIFDPVTKQPYTKCPRNIAAKAIDYLKKTGIGDTAFFGPEAEFFIFDSIRFDSYSPNQSFFYLDSTEAYWNTGADFEENRGFIAGNNRGYFPAAPTDTLADIRSEMVLAMQEAGMRIEAQHHEVASAGQGEIDYRFAPLVTSADYLMILKYIVKNVAQKHGKTATFMPKPIENENGNGMHINVSVWKKNKPVFAGKEYAGLSENALYFIGGILKHAPSLMAFTNSTTNSYKRLVPGFEAPVYLAYSQRNRSAAIRIPMYTDNPKARRLEIRFPDPATNPYLGFSAVLLAGIDGIKRKIDPGKPVDKNIFELSKKEAAKIKTTPSSLQEALDSLKKDNAYLLENGVFTEEVLETWIEYKLEQEIKPLERKPHPHEFTMYYSV
jgi:glutamine synthetase